MREIRCCGGKHITTIGTLIAAVLCMNDKTTNDSLYNNWVAQVHNNVYTLELSYSGYRNSYSYNGANVYYITAHKLVQSRNPSKVNISIHLNRFCLLKCLKQLLSMSELLDVQDIQESSLLHQG